jgi:hypothetical protein
MSQEQYNQTRQDNAPFLQSGTAANNQLAALLGLSQTAKSRAQIEKELRAQGAGDVTRPSGNVYFVNSKLQAAVDQVMAQQQAQQAAQQAAQQSGTFGSLLKPFSQADLDKDPIYQNTINFALEQGTQGINRQAAATGSQLSGATLKALSRFGANTAATYGNDAFNRDQAQDSGIYNRLAGVSGAGQQAVNQVTSAGQNYANNVGNNLIGAGNARGASAIAGANSFNNALGSAVNGYQTQQLLKGLNRNQNSFGWAGMNGFGDSYGTSYGE